MSRTKHARTSRADHALTVAHWTNALEGMRMLTTIAEESKNGREYARRAEAWNASESKKLSDKQLATLYVPAFQRQTDMSKAEALRTLLAFISTARSARIRGQELTWNRLALGVDKDVES